MMIELPFPPASLSGHAKGKWWNTSPVVAKHREWAKRATVAAGGTVSADGDICVSATFYPPNRRGDRINFPNRMKAFWDGVADGLTENCGFRVNDSRFVPAYHFAQPARPGCVVITIREAGE